MDAIQSRGDEWRLAGFIDPQACESTSRRFGVQRLGDDATALAQIGAYWFVLGIGAIDADVRARIAQQYDQRGARWAAIIHARAYLACDVAVSGGTFVSAGAVVNPGARLEAHCVVNTGAVVEHDCRIGAFAHVGPGAVLGGAVTVGERAFLGLGCRVRDHLSIGAGVVVGMGAVVTRSVAEGTVVGVPARSRSGA